MYSLGNDDPASVPTERHHMTDTAHSDKGTPRSDEQFVPAWLAALVLVLLLAVMGVGGYVLRGVIAGDTRPQSVQATQIAKWKAEVEKDPSDLEARLQLGYAYQLDRKFDRALKEYGVVLREDPNNTAAWYNRGIVYQELGLNKQSEDALWKVLSIQPDHVLSAKALGEYYAAKHQYRSLLRAVRPVVEVHPEMADLQYLTAVAYEKTGHEDWAIVRYRLALKYAPDMVEASDALKRLGERP